MADKFFNLPIESQQALLLNAENELNMPAQVLEKDVWLCIVLETLFSLPIEMAFKGGTSLSKVFGLIHRFSEDVDITIDYRNFRKDLDISNTSRSQLKKISNELKMLLEDCVINNIIPGLKNSLQTNYPNLDHQIELGEDGENLHFYYPSTIGSNNNYLRDHVLIEFGVRNDTQPNKKHLVSPYLKNSINESITLPYATVNTLSPVRTFWEKATLIHVECQRVRIGGSPERLSRHWYDLFHFSKSAIGETALEDTDTLRHVVQHKKAFFNASYCNYDACLENTFQIIPNQVKIQGLQKDYKKMIDAGMFTEIPPTFEELIEELKKLELEINKVR